MSTPNTDYPTLSPYLCVRDGAKALAFYQAAFGATERFRLTDKTSGKVGHAEILVGGALVMLSEENPQWGNKSPLTLGGSPVTFCLMVENADAALARAVAAGATELMPAADQFYGFRSASVSDLDGHQWMLQHELEKVSPEELQKRWDGMSAQCGGRETTQ
ncbi:MAG: VOC family protein [Burkholderiales bacterium]|nr:VOC family protein [Opitutaceae bacterium]